LLNHDYIQMSFTILPPSRTFPADDSGGVDSDGDTAMAHAPSTALGTLVTPGELVTDDPQWMRSALPLRLPCPR
jgi:hypothetical protein